MAKIMIDIGHGGSDSGASGNGLIEKNINLKVGLMLRNYLSKYDAEVRVTRETDLTLSDDNRVGLVNSFNPDFCISVHHNAVAQTTARGAEVIHAYYDKADDVLAEKILDNLAAIGMPKRRVFTKLNSKNNDWYFMIRRIWNSGRTAIITEGGFITNSEDAELLKKDDFLKNEAEAIGSAIAEYLKLKPKQDKWWVDVMKRLKNEGLIEKERDGDEPVTWGEFAAVISRMLDKMNTK